MNAQDGTAQSADGGKLALLTPPLRLPVMLTRSQQDRIPVHFTKSKEQINMFFKLTQIKRLNYKYFSAR